MTGKLGVLLFEPPVPSLTMTAPSKSLHIHPQAFLILMMALVPPL